MASQNITLSKGFGLLFEMGQQAVGKRSPLLQ